MLLVLEVGAYLADAAVLGSYALVARGLLPVRSFHWANAIGFPSVAAVEALTGAWPAFVLTVAFGLIGWAGVLHRPKYLSRSFRKAVLPIRPHLRREYR